MWCVQARTLRNCGGNLITHLDPSGLVTQLYITSSTITYTGPAAAAPGGPAEYPPGWNPDQPVSGEQGGFVASA
jgi:hypothetical protein